MFADELISENQSLDSVYSALYRVCKYLKFLEERGKNINTVTPMDIKVYSATRLRSL